jgi:hypothetical protein
MKQPKDQYRYWAFAADPNRYRIIDAVANLETDWWTTQGRPVRPGEHAVIWQLRDHQGRRGIVALAEIAADPQMRSDAGNPYWVNPEDGTEVKERVEVRYIRLNEPLWIDGPYRDVVASLSVSRAHGGTVFNVTPDQWHAILSATEGASETSVERDIAEIKNRKNLSPTQKAALIQARRGQGAFRRDLMQYWGGCAVVGCTVSSVLRASHIKPWSKSSDQERLDASNGLLLTANLDALFNDGLITFEPDGRMLVSERLSSKDRALLQLGGTLRKSLTPSQQTYLRFHREILFRCAPEGPFKRWHTQIPTARYLRAVS